MRHYFTLSHIAKEISKDFDGAIITDCYSQEKNTVVLQLEKDKQVICLEFAMHPGNAAIYRKDGMRRASGNSVSLFPDLIGRAFLRCTIHPTDRILFFQCTGATLIAQLFGGSNTALFSVDEYNVVHSIFKRCPVSIGEEYFPAISSAATLIEIERNCTLGDALQRTHGLGKLYTHEILHKINATNNLHIDASTLLNELHHDVLLKMESETVLWKQQCLDSETAYIIETLPKKYELSCLPLAQYSTIVWQGNSYCEAVRRIRILNFKAQDFTNRYSQLLSQLELLQKKTKRSIEHLQDDATSQLRSEKAHLFGTLLLSVEYPALRIHKNHVEIEHEGVLLSIKTNPLKTYSEMAAEYFKKAQSAKQNDVLRRSHLPLMTDKLLNIQRALKALQTAQSLHELDDIKKQYSVLFAQNESQSKSERNHQFREFRLSKHFTLFIGKNAQSNDELTTRFAKPNDIWMHARGVSGSHAVLKGKAQVPKDILELAAQITAHFSQARTGSYVPVAYTQKKYVRKPRKSAPGSVVMEREEVIMVKPELPEQFKQAFAS